MSRSRWLSFLLLSFTGVVIPALALAAVVTAALSQYLTVTYRMDVQDRQFEGHAQGRGATGSWPRTTR